MKRTLIFLLIFSTSILLNAQVPKRFGFLVGETAIGLAVLGYIAKKIFNLCRPEIEKDIDKAIEKTVHDKKIDKVLEKAVHEELKDITRILSKNILFEVGAKLTQKERDTLNEFS